MRVWIDITNSPHVLFFEPIVRDLIEQGHDVEITTRDYAQTLGLLDQKGMRYTLIGKHQGSSMGRKALGLLSRSARLAAWAARRRFDVAFSHNSQDLALAARLLGVPHLIVFDYEHAKLAHAINTRFANRVLVPEAIPTEAIVAHGATPAKVGHFPGLKEHVYLYEDMPWEDLRSELGANDETILTVIRPPATMSTYHRFENDLFSQVITHLGDTPNVLCVLLPRTPQQRADLVEGGLPDNVMVPEGVLPAVSLLRSADLVISAGGTMNREAAALGTPAYTVFAGKMGAVDEYLIREGRMVQVDEPGDVEIRRKDADRGWWIDNRKIVLDELFALSKGDA